MNEKNLAEVIINETVISVHRAFKIFCVSRTMYYYGHKKGDQTVVSKLLYLEARYHSRSFETYYGKIRLKVCFGAEKEYCVFIKILI